MLYDNIDLIINCLIATYISGVVAITAIYSKKTGA